MADDGQYLARLQDYYARHQVLPSYARIGKLVGLNTVKVWLDDRRGPS